MPKRKCPEEKIRRLEAKLEKYKKRVEMRDDESVQEVDPSQVECPEIESLIEQAPESELEGPDEEEALIAKALGEPHKEESFSEEVNTNLAAVMEAILEKGLSKSEKDKLKEIKIPGNCKLLIAPNLNAELSAIVSAPAKTRDKLLQERQHELGQSAGNIVHSINLLSHKDFSKAEVIEKLGEASRLICNLHCQYTFIRRKLINPFLDKNLSESLKANGRGENLYTNLEESVKSFSAIKRASNILKPKAAMTNKPCGNTRPQSVNNTKFIKNYQQPRRQSQSSHNRRGAYHQRIFHHQQMFKEQDRRHQSGPSNRGRAKYP